MKRWIVSLFALGLIAGLVPMTAPLHGSGGSGSAVAKADADFAPLPRPVSSFGAAVADGWLYVYGGHGGTTHEYSTETVVGSLLRLKLANPKAWEELPPGPGLQGLAVVAHGGMIYRIGGMQPRNKPGEKADNHSVATVSRFDPSTKKWENLPDLPEGRSSHDAVVAGDKIVVVGGWNMKGAGSNVWSKTAVILDLKQQPLKWRTVQQPFERRALAAATLGGKVFVCGGISADAGIKLTTNVYDAAKDQWTSGPDLPEPSSNGFSPAACTAGDRLYVSLGDGKVVRLSAKAESWEEVGRLKQARIVHRMVAGPDNLLVVVGGSSKSGTVALTETLRP
jgi:N-acetylneuraminic acid mutarotase